MNIVLRLKNNKTIKNVFKALTNKVNLTSAAKLENLVIKRK